MVLDGLVIIGGGFGENVGIRFEVDGCAVLFFFAGSDFLQMLDDLSAVDEFDVVDSTSFADGDFTQSGEGVDDRGADTMQTARDFVASAFAELTAGVKDCIGGFNTG